MTTEPAPPVGAARSGQSMVRLLFRLTLLLLALIVLAFAALRGWAAWREAGNVADDDSGSRIVVAGLAIHYREWGPADGPPLLLVHGAMAWSQTWRDIAAPLGEDGFRVIAPDLPPFGHSQRPADRDYSRVAQADLIRGFADAIGLDRFALAGHSFGGGATVEAALALGGRVERLILLDVALGLGNEDAGPPMAGLLGMRPLRNALVSATFTNPLMIGKGLRDFIHDDALVTPERIALYRRPLDRPGTTDAVGDWFMTGLFGDERATRAADPGAYRAFAAPVLVIWGREDTVTPLDQGRAIAALFPDARLAVLDDVNHIPHVEAPARTAELIAAFLAR